MVIKRFFKRITRPIVLLFHKIVNPETRRYLIILFFVIFVTSFIETLRRDLNLASALVAFGTLILAAITAWSILSGREKEDRDRKERLLDEIIKWAESITAFSSDADIDLYLKLQAAGGISEREREIERSHRAELLSIALAINKRATYMKIVADDIKVALNKALIEVVENLNSTIEVLREGIINKVTTTKVGLSTQALSESANKLIEEATDAKLELLNT